MSSENEYSQEPIDDLALKVIFLFAFFAIFDHFLMQNHQLAPAKYHFHDSHNEHLMFRSETNIVEKIHYA